MGLALGHLSLTAFLLLLSVHLGSSMQLPLVTWTGLLLTLLAASRLARIERPTRGLLFVLFATGGLAGSQILEDWAVDGSWPQDNGFGAGITISLLLYLVWVFAARIRRETESAIDRDEQSIVVWGLLSLLLITPADELVVPVGVIEFPFVTVLGVLLGCVSLFADRCGRHLPSRLALLAPLLILIPVTQLGLQAGQGPVVSALSGLMPRTRDFGETGFSPFQTLRASVFLRPSTDPVMRIQSDGLPSRYLAGNRLVLLNQELVWLPSERPLRSYSTVDAELLDDDSWRYEIENHHARSDELPFMNLAVHSLENKNYIFVTPGTNYLTGRFTGISRNAADVWTPNFERGAEHRWLLETGEGSVPDDMNPETIALPDFWDAPLQAHSESFAGPDRQSTVDNLVNYFLSRDYSLRTNFDPERPFHDFFLSDKAAYCFWFASATTLALRANGIPSRLVGGYLIHEQLSDDLWLVRERDAHSWVEWQDSEGFWHTVDPTPASIETFFGGYQSSPWSQWYHRLANNWQQFLDRLLADETMANLIRYGGLAILVFLFTREYLRLRQRRQDSDDLSRRWNRLWQRFLKISELPRHPAWTAGTYVENLPRDWSEGWREQVSQFLKRYQSRRFAAPGSESLLELEAELIQLHKAKSNRRVHRD